MQFSPQDYHDVMCVLQDTKTMNQKEGNGNISTSLTNCEHIQLNFTLSNTRLSVKHSVNPWHTLPFTHFTK